MTANARASMRGGQRDAWPCAVALGRRLGLARAGERQNTMPQPMRHQPGHHESPAPAEPLHEECRSPARPTAMPRLPASPLMPIVAPGRWRAAPASECPPGGRSEAKVPSSANASASDQALASAPPAAPTRPCRRRTPASSRAAPTSRPAGRPATSPGRTSGTRPRCRASGLPSAQSRTRRRWCSLPWRRSAGTCDRARAPR